MSRRAEDGLYIPDIRECPICGNPFVVEHTGQRFCGAHTRSEKRKWYHKNIPDGTEGPVKKPNKAIRQIAKEAHNEGISYGQLMARREIEKRREAESGGDPVVHDPGDSAWT